MCACAPGPVQPVVRVRAPLAWRVPGAADAAHRAPLLARGRAHGRAAHPVAAERRARRRYPPGRGVRAGGAHPAPAGCGPAACGAPRPSGVTWLSPPAARLARRAHARLAHAAVLPARDTLILTQDSFGRRSGTLRARPASPAGWPAVLALAAMLMTGRSSVGHRRWPGIVSPAATCGAQASSSARRRASATM